MNLEVILKLLGLNDQTHIVVQGYTPYLGVYPICGGNLAHVVKRVGAASILRSDIRDNILYIVILER